MLKLTRRLAAHLGQGRIEGVRAIWPPVGSVRRDDHQPYLPQFQACYLRCDAGTRRVLARLVEERGAEELSYSTVRDYVRVRRAQVDVEAGRGWKCLSRRSMPRVRRPRWISVKSGPS